MVIIDDVEDSPQRYMTGGCMAKSGNPRLRQIILDVVHNQLRDGTPPETATTLERLIREGHSREQAMELIAAVVTSEIFGVLKEGRPYDGARYVAALHALPRMPWEGQEET
jgi:hypothetical protein